MTSPCLRACPPPCAESKCALRRRHTPRLAVSATDLSTFAREAMKGLERPPKRLFMAGADVAVLCAGPETVSNGFRSLEAGVLTCFRSVFIAFQGSLIFYLHPNELTGATSTESVDRASLGPFKKWIASCGEVWTRRTSSSRCCDWERSSRHRRARDKGGGRCRWSLSCWCPGRWSCRGAKMPPAF